MIEVLKQSAEDVSKVYDILAFGHTERALEILAKTRTSLRQAIAEAEKQEQPLPPVEIGVDVTADGASVVAFYRRSNAVMEMFYSQFHPAPQRTWVGLTDEEVKHQWEVWRANIPRYAGFAKGIETKLKERNL